MQPGTIPVHDGVYRNLQKLCRFVPTYCILCFMMVIIFRFVFKYLHSRHYQQQLTKTVPELPWMTYLRVMIAGRKCVDVSFLKVIFGACCLYWKEGMYAIKMGPVNYVFLYHPDAVEFLLGSRTILHKGPEYDVFKKIFGDGLFMTNSSKWHKRRKQATPTMHFRILEDFFPAFNERANALVDTIDELMKKQTNIPILHIVGLCVFDSMLETMMGVKVKDIEPQRKLFFETIRRADVILSKRVSLPWYWSDFIFSRTKEAKVLQNYRNIFRNFIKEVIELRKRDMEGTDDDATENNKVKQSNNDTSVGNKERMPTLDLLMNLHLKTKSVTYEEMIDEILNFMAAGHDTSNLAVSWTLYLLGLNPDIQRNVHQELDDVFGDDIDRIVTAEEIRSLNYLHCVLKESMRLYPPAGIITRILEEDVIINGYGIEKGAILVVPLYMLHRDPDIFPDPEKFIPERFSKENYKKVNPFAYVPFSAGPRNCIGQRFAIYNVITVLSTVLRHFTVEAVEPRDKTEIAFNLMVVPENDIRLKFTRRQILRDY